ncbi:MAG: flagellar hook capping FlgD N-terminal domain-containing protein [Terracidiphilus sp.]|nr:flagellar hook capping FlgD N-terminal domain-containing protein [Terracidiphilus sp.]
MASLASGLLNHTSSAAQALSGTGGTSASSSLSDAADASSTSSSSSTITANDFLTLLVTEMKNQDPTATTDPNEYINQLVNVNSLQQLISINETLTNSLGTNAKAGTGQTASDSSTVNSTASSGTTGKGTASTVQSMTSAAKVATGNISTPDVNPAASTLAHALDGHKHVGSLAGGSFGAQ